MFALIGEVKMALRVNSETFDVGEIEPIIKACLKDLEIAGVRNIKDNDPLIRRAVVLYAKWQFGYADDSERFAKHYLALRDTLALSMLYSEVTE